MWRMVVVGQLRTVVHYVQFVIKKALKLRVKVSEDQLEGLAAYPFNSNTWVSYKD